MDAPTSDLSYPRPTRVATIDEIEQQGWSLHPGRFVGTEVEDIEDELFDEHLAAATVELARLNKLAAGLQAELDEVLSGLMGG